MSTIRMRLRALMAALAIGWPTRAAWSSRCIRGRGSALEAIGLDAGIADPAVRLLEPLGYLDFLALQRRRGARADRLGRRAGGDDLPWRALPHRCAPNTERPATITFGTNRLVACDTDALVSAIAGALDGTRPPARRPPLWDGRAAERIAAVFQELAGGGAGPRDVRA